MGNAARGGWGPRARPRPSPRRRPTTTTTLVSRFPNGRLPTPQRGDGDAAAAARDGVVAP
eukprot:30834-Pelagococcus_subviridis.AAC.7